MILQSKHDLNWIIYMNQITNNMSTTKQLKKIIYKVSDKNHYNYIDSIEHVLNKLNKIYLKELQYQREVNK